MSASHELSRTAKRKLNQVLKEDTVQGNFMKMFISICVCFTSFIGHAEAASAPDQVEVSQMAQHPQDVVSASIRSVPSWAKCPALWNRLRDAGWLEKDVLKADQIVWRESRCIATAHNSKDPNTVQGVKGSLGLFQINLFWIQRTTFYPKGYLQTVLGREFVPADLFDVDVTIDAAGALIAYDRAQGKCGWSAWIGC